MTELTHHMGADGRPAAEIAGHGAPCAMVASVNGEPVACGLPAGHRSPHGFADLPGAPRGSRVPGRSGDERTQAARAASRGPVARQGSAADMCSEPSKGGAMACAYSPGHRGKHSWSKVESKAV